MHPWNAKQALLQKCHRRKIGKAFNLSVVYRLQQRVMASQLDEKKNRIVCVRHISVSTKSQNHSNSLFMFPFAYFHSQERLSNNTESFNKEDLPKRKTVLMIKHSSQSTCCSSAAGSQTVWSRCLAAPETKQNTWVLPWPDLWGHTQTKFTLSRHN